MYFIIILKLNILVEGSFYLDELLPLGADADPGDEEFFVHQQLRFGCCYLTLDPTTHGPNIYIDTKP
jgi:hypothetical protein